MNEYLNVGTIPVGVIHELSLQKCSLYESSLSRKTMITRKGREIFKKIFLKQFKRQPVLYIILYDIQGELFRKRAEFFINEFSEIIFQMTLWESEVGKLNEIRIIDSQSNLLAQSKENFGTKLNNQVWVFNYKVQICFNVPIQGGKCHERLE